MNKILVPIDFSENSLNALEYAVKIAKEVSGEITLLNSYPIDVPMGMEYATGIYMQTLNKEMQIDRETRLKEVAAMFTDEYYRFSEESVQINLVVKEGAPSDSIANLLEEERFDIIVMGTQGASGFEEILLGSITAAVIDRVKVPVLAVPANARFQGFKKVVYATDFDSSDMKLLDILQEYAEYFNSDITCLHVNTEPSLAYANGQKMDVLKQNFFFAPLRQINFEMIYKEKVDKGLQEYLTENQVDMLVVKPQHRSFIEKLFHSSLTRKMAFHTKIPMLVARS